MLSFAKTYPRFLVVLEDKLLCARILFLFSEAASSRHSRRRPSCCKLDDTEICSYKWVKKARWVPAWAGRR